LTRSGIKRSIGFHKIREEKFLPSTLLKRGQFLRKIEKMALEILIR